MYGNGLGVRIHRAIDFFYHSLEMNIRAIGDDEIYFLPLGNLADVALKDIQVTEHSGIIGHLHQ